MRTTTCLSFRVMVFFCCRYLHFLSSTVLELRDTLILAQQENETTQERLSKAMDEIKQQQDTTKESLVRFLRFISYCNFA